MELFKNESGVYVVRFFTERGIRERSTKATNLEDARQVVKDARIAELEHAAKAKSLNAEALTAIMSGRRITCAAAVEEWAKWKEANGESPNTIRTQGFVLRGLIAGIENKPIARLTEEFISDFVNAKDGTSLSNRRLRIGAIRGLMKFASARAYIVGNPAQNVRINMRQLSHRQKEPEPRTPFTRQEYDRIIAGTSGFWQHATALAYWAGLRLSDVCNLEWDSIGAREIVVWTLKTDARVALPLSDPLIGSGALAMTILSLMDEQRHQRHVFPEQRKEYADPALRGKYSVYYGRILKRLGIEGKSFHCLRHSFVTRLKQDGRPLEEIGRLVGHADEKTTAGYAH